jgi:hypothetical protein
MTRNENPLLAAEYLEAAFRDAALKSPEVARQKTHGIAMLTNKGRNKLIWRIRSDTSLARKNKKQDQRNFQAT